MFESAIPVLEEFVSAIGLDPKRLPEWEEFHRLSIGSYNLLVSKVSKLEPRHFAQLTKAFEDCFSCKFLLYPEDLDHEGEERVILNAKQHISQSDIQKFFERIQDVNSVEFSFRLDKDKMLAKAGIEAADTNFHLYLFPTALTRFLRGENLVGEPCNAYESLKTFEENLWHGQSDNEIDEKAVILVLDHDIKLKGEHFALIGGKHLESWQDILPGHTSTAEAEAIYETCRANVFWDKQWVSHLIPPKLKLSDGTWEADDPMVTALRIQLFNLIVLFTASRIAGGTDWTATYSSSRGAVDVLLRSPAQEELEASVLSNIDLLYDIFTWVYFSKWPHDRIAFVRSAITDELTHYPPEDANKMLLERVIMLKISLDNQWDSFTREQLQAYSEEEQALENAVMETVDAFSERVAAMGKSVSDAMLAAIAALLGSFVAAGLGTQDFNPLIFRVGMIVYSMYVLVFPFLYNMRAQWLQYNMLKDGIHGRMKRLRQKLSEKRMEEIAGTRFEQSDRNFLFWFRITVGIYILVVLVGIAAAFVVPLLIDSG